VVNTVTKECDRSHEVELKMVTTAIAHPMQALVKYHGLKDWKLRIPFHDSVSVNVDALWTKTSVEFGDFEQDYIEINNKPVQGDAFQRCLAVVNRVRELAGTEDRVKVMSENSLDYAEAKGLGFSSSGGAALAAAAFKAARLDEEYGWDLKLIAGMPERMMKVPMRKRLPPNRTWTSAWWSFHFHQMSGQRGRTQRS